MNARGNQVISPRFHFAEDTGFALLEVGFHVSNGLVDVGVTVHFRVLLQRCEGRVEAWLTSSGGPLFVELALAVSAVVATHAALSLFRLEQSTTVIAVQQMPLDRDEVSKDIVFFIGPLIGDWGFAIVA